MREGHFARHLKKMRGLYARRRSTVADALATAVRAHGLSRPALERILVATPAGAQIPLSQVAKLEFAMGPPFLRSEAGKLVAFVTVDVADRAIGDYVADAQRVLAEQLELPAGLRLVWAGQYEHLQRARARLLLVVPITLLLIAALLYFNTGSLIETGIVLLALPFSLVGAVWLLFALDYHLSVAVGVGLIALAGLDAQTGVVMLLYLTLAHARRSAEGRRRYDAARGHFPGWP